MVFQSSPLGVWSVGNMLEQVIEDGAEEGSDEHYYATQLLIKKRIP
jgi:hypothetical protein